MKTVNEKNVSIDEIIDILKNGGLIIFPTETMYGAGVDATNITAIKKLNLYKKRPTGKPYSIAVADIAMAKKYVNINKTAEDIYNTFLPGPVTVISKGKHKVAPGIESENGTLGIRIPNYKLVLEIVKAFGKPITATSANASYKKRPYKISDILENISDKRKGLIDLIIDAGKLPRNEPSTVVDTSYDDPTVLRQGNISLSGRNEILSKSPDDTKNCAKELWQKYETFSGKRAIVFALSGEMGTGKTIFTKGLAKAMQIKEIVVSPTFNLSITYPRKGKLPRLTHIDVWRIGGVQELKDINLQKEINDKSIIAIEWAEKISDEIRRFNEEAVIIWVNIENGKNINDRIINWEAI